jgi:asparagine synthase (glutamine-hydrolysing)
VAPAYYCAKLAADSGVERMLAGDGGHELFGAIRYAKQSVSSRSMNGSPAVCELNCSNPRCPHLAAGTHSGNQEAVSYVERARVPMPDRLQAYNLLTWLGPAQVLTATFSLVDPEEPLQQRAVYRACAARSLVNRMLAYD